MKTGDELAPLVIDPVSPEPMKTMAALLRDPSPIHFDAEVVRGLGLGERPINQGPMNIAYLIELAARNAGGPRALRRIRVRLLGNVFAGDRVECRGQVTGVDEHEIHLELTATVGERPVASGQATLSRT